MRGSPMRSTIFVGVVLVAATAMLWGQLPLPAGLLKGDQIVYMGSAGVEGSLLDRAAREIETEGIYTLTENHSKANLVLTIMPGREGDTLRVPIGALLFSSSNEFYRLVVQDRVTSEVLWDDSREAGRTPGGAILDLVKDLHKAIRQEQSRHQ